MDTAQWPQGIGVAKAAIESSKPNNGGGEKKPRPEKEQALNCPRCNSTNTKFCYYNNYSLSQPRYFCKTCRRYWTEGGSLRNVPVGGGSRKNKRSSPAAAAPQPLASAKKALSDPNFSPQNPKIQEGHDLNLAYNPSQYNAISEFAALHQTLGNPNSERHHHNLPLMELLKSGGGLGSFMVAPISDAAAAGGFPAPDFKPNLGFSVDAFGNMQQDQANQTSRMLFPFEELKPVSNHDQFEQDRAQGETNVYWNGMLAGGSWC